MKISVFASTPDLSLDLGAEYGYADNLNNALANSLKEGSSFTTTWASAGIATSSPGTIHLYLKGSYDAVDYVAFHDLSVYGWTAQAGLISSVRESWLLKISSSIGMRSYGDSDRDSIIYDFLFSLEHNTFSKLKPEITYRYSKNDAEESVFGYSSNKISISGEFQIAQKGYLTLDYSVEFRENTFYETSVISTPVIRGRRSSNTFGANQIAVKEDATVQTISLLWDQSIYKGLYGLAGYSHFWGTSKLGDYTGQMISGGIGYKF